MGVYIKGIKMPKNCRECSFEGYHVDMGQTYCMACLNVLATAFKPISFDGRSKWCPLVEVPEPHGRLIDENELTRSTNNIVHKAMIFGGQVCYSQSDIDNVPTVIEAEGERWKN